MSKYGHREYNWFEGIVNKLGEEEGAERFLRGELMLVPSPIPSIPPLVDRDKLAALISSGGDISPADVEKCRIPKWTIAPNGVIYLALPPTKGWKEEWIDYFQQEGHDPSEYAKSVIRSKEFQPTTGIIHHIAILPAKLWPDSDRITRRMRQDATAGVFTPGQNLTDPNAEVGCLIRDFLTDEEIKALGLGRIVTMHPPILDFDGSPSLLAAFRDGDGSYLSAYGDDPDAQWGDAGGFVWSVPQVSA